MYCTNVGSWTWAESAAYIKKRNTTFSAQSLLDIWNIEDSRIEVFSVVFQTSNFTVPEIICSSFENVGVSDALDIPFLVLELSDETSEDISGRAELQINIIQQL